MNKSNKRLKGFAEFSREVAAEGAVLLKNEKQTLPIKNGETVSVFGRFQLDYYKSGTGSGGLVNVEYVINIIDGLRSSDYIKVNEKLSAIYEEWINNNPFDFGTGWGQEPWSQTEMSVTDEMVADAAEESDIALVVIGRTAGEDQDSRNEEGSFLLTSIEEDMIAKVSKNFDRVAIILNVGNVIDINWINKYNTPAVLYVWQGGMEGGKAVAEVLTGQVTPSGKLSDTIAYNLSDYPSYHNFGRDDYNLYQEDIYVGYRYFETVAPEKVQFPFGFGMSYTTFHTSVLSVNVKNEELQIELLVTNTGEYSGKEVVQIYYGAPQGVLGKPLKVLAAFMKTKKLEPNESQQMTLSFAIGDMASYDDSGVTGHKSCYVLEPGDYKIYAGNDVRKAELVYVHTIQHLIVTRQLSEALAPTKSYKRMKPEKQQDGSYHMIYEEVPTRTINLTDRINKNRPNDISQTGDKGYKLSDVYDGKVTMEKFIAQLSDFEMACLIRGEGMCSPKVTPGTGAAFGGITEGLQYFGITAGCCSDGPSGIRMDCGTYATSIPNGTLLACTWNTDIVEQLYVMEGKELLMNRIDLLLGPGINIHRHPLNGRNFEYFSEDPLLTGVMAIAQIKGMQSVGTSGTLKHFAGNNQETSRHNVDSIISERALREIYLKGFEMAIMNANARSVMTSYGAVNGIWTAGNYDLNTTILREEWGFEGMVMTDWWAKINEEGEEATVKNTGAMVRAQNDVYMVVEDSFTNSAGDNTEEALSEGSITRGELQRNAMNICTVLLKSPALQRLMNKEQYYEDCNEIDDDSVEFNNEQEVIQTVINDDATILMEGMDTGKGKSTTYTIQVNNTGMYQLSLKMRAEGSSLAQMPLSIFVNGSAVATFVMNGTDGRWITMTKEINLMVGKRYIKLYFGQSGIEIQEMHFLLQK